MCYIVIIIVIRSARNRKKLHDDHQDDSGKMVGDSHSIQVKNEMIDSRTESNTIKNANADDKKPVYSKNGVTIINIDVPDSQNAENQISLGEHEINEKQIASTTTAITITTATNVSTNIEQNAADSIGGDTWLRQKQWHRRLHTPVWARCSIKIKFFSYTFCALFLPLYLFFSL